MFNFTSQNVLFFSTSRLTDVSGIFSFSSHFQQHPSSLLFIILICLSAWPGGGVVRFLTLKKIQISKETDKRVGNQAE